MKSSFLKTTFFLFLFVIAVQFVDRYFFDQKINHFGAGAIKKPFSYFFVKLEDAGFFLHHLIKIRSTINENENLKKENLILTSQFADYEDLKSENNFLRNTLRIPSRLSRTMIYASIYDFQFSVGGYDVLINKGTNDGIYDSDIVITGEGVLIGIIEKAFDEFSRVMVVSDPNFSVAAKVLGFSTAGIAKGALDKGLYFDLIIQEDLIKEGDTIVTSGLDVFPPDLIIGRVNYVETNETSLFKKVKIRPAMEDVKIGRVFVIPR